MVIRLRPSMGRVHPPLPTHLLSPGRANSFISRNLVEVDQNICYAFAHCPSQFRVLLEAVGGRGGGWGERGREGGREGGRDREREGQSKGRREGGRVLKCYLRRLGAIRIGSDADSD